MLVLATVVFLLIVIPNNTCAGLQLGRALKHKETNYRVEEGDMLFPIKTAGWTPDDAGDPTFPHSGVVRKYSWPEGIIPYVLLEDDIDVKEILALRRAMDEIMRETCIVFTPRTEEFNYVLIHRGFGGCLSRVGCNMAENEYGSQELRLGRGCFDHVTLLHELMHTIGFFHEQSRPDRDNFVRIIKENIEPGQEQNFYKLDNTRTFGLPYDFNSILHYEPTDFSKNGEPTIVSKVPGRKIKRGNTMSGIDKLKVNTMYKCSPRSSNSISTTTTATTTSNTKGKKATRPEADPDFIPSVTSPGPECPPKDFCADGVRAEKVTSNSSQKPNGNLLTVTRYDYTCNLGGYWWCEHQRLTWLKPAPTPPTRRSALGWRLAPLP